MGTLKAVKHVKWDQRKEDTLWIKFCILKDLILKP